MLKELEGQLIFLMLKNLGDNRTKSSKVRNIG